MAALAVSGQGTLARAAAPTEDGVALAIIYDTSGSMKDPVRDRDGRSTPKYVIANRALISLARQIQAFATNAPGGTPRKIETALYTFSGDGPHEAMPMAPFDASALESWANNFSHPSGNTPLGNTLRAAGRAVLKSPLSHKHVLVITDGVNTAGPAPSATLPGLQKQAQQQETSLGVHFIAFDVDANVFSSVKRQGATVVSAADEKQLNSQVDFILQKKILLEDEEPPKSK
jgi:von Willebrand factor type A domain